MCPEEADRMANSVDPDQTAPWSSLIWACTVLPDLSVPVFSNDFVTAAKRASLQRVGAGLL